MIIPITMNFTVSNINWLVKFLNKQELMLLDKIIRKMDILKMKKLLKKTV